MKRILFIPLVFICSVLLYSNESAGDKTSVQVKASITPAKATVGTALKYTIIISGPDSADIDVLLPSDRIFKPEKAEDDADSAGSVPLYIIGEASRKENRDGGVPSSEIDVEITFYRTGEYSLPNLKVIDKSGLEYSYQAPVAVIESVNKEGTLEDIEPPFALSGNYTRLYIILAVLVFAAALVFSAVKYLSKRIKVETPELIVRPPYEIFMEEVDKSDPLSLIDKGEVKQYVFTVSILFRKYISSLYNFDAAEMTTWEISLVLGSVMPDHIYTQYSSDIIDIMNFWDLSKFAEFAPSRELLEQNYRSTLDVALKLSTGGEVN